MRATRGSVAAYPRSGGAASPIHHSSLGRLLGFDPPESIRELNTQDEMSLHNLAPVQGFLHSAYIIVGLIAGLGWWAAGRLPDGGLRRTFEVILPGRLTVPTPCTFDASQEEQVLGPNPICQRTALTRAAASGDEVSGSSPTITTGCSRPTPKAALSIGCEGLRAIHIFSRSLGVEQLSVRPPPSSNLGHGTMATAVCQKAAF